jgi:hypothetical protein
MSAHYCLAVAVNDGVADDSAPAVSLSPLLFDVVEPGEGADTAASAVDAS